MGCPIVRRDSNDNEAKELFERYQNHFSCADALKNLGSCQQALSKSGKPGHCNDLAEAFLDCKTRQHQDQKADVSHCSSCFGVIEISIERLYKKCATTTNQQDCLSKLKQFIICAENRN